MDLVCWSCDSHMFSLAVYMRCVATNCLVKQERDFLHFERMTHVVSCTRGSEVCVCACRRAYVCVCDLIFFSVVLNCQLSCWLLDLFLLCWIWSCVIGSGLHHLDTLKKNFFLPCLGWLIMIHCWQHVGLH